MVEEKNEGEKELKEKDIDEALTKVIDTEGDFENPSHIIKFLTKIIFNLRYDLNELKQELIKVLGAGVENEPEYEELKYPNKKHDWNKPARFGYEIYS